MEISKSYLKLIAHESSVVNPKCKIRANNDLEAIERWLDEYFEKPTTFRTYKKEAERFLLWVWCEQKKKLALLTREDIDYYVEFLKNPQIQSWKPQDINFKPNWSAFRKPLSLSSIKASLTILNSMMQYLVQAYYIEFNPFVLVRKKGQFKTSLAEQAIKVQERILQPQEWEIFLQAANSYPEESLKDKQKKFRLLFLLSTFFYLGLRLEELSNARWCDFRNINQKWWFFVKGKGDKLGKIPVNSYFLKDIITYRHFLGLSVIPNETQDEFVFKGIDNQKQLTTRHISNLIKEVAHKAAELCKDNVYMAEKMKKISPHWLRHLSASKQDLAGISFTNISQNLRHQNEQTTRHYIHSFDDDRHKDMEKLKIF